MSEKMSIRLSGSGGQGLILAGIILAEAAILDQKNAIQSQSYGPEARGGASKAEVIISNDQIKYPKIITPDLLLSISPESCEKYGKDIKDNGVLIVDSSIKLDDDCNFEVISIPIIETAIEKIGRSMVSNIVALGAIQELTKVVTIESLEEAVFKRVPPSTRSLNRSALAEGAKLVLNR